jgi:hypothetical protein
MKKQMERFLEATLKDEHLCVSRLRLKSKICKETGHRAKCLAAFKMLHYMLTGHIFLF